MNHHYSLPLLALLAWAALWMKVDSSITYCSTVSTGSSSSSNFSIYQSEGNCQEHCSGSAFGILLDKNCWCSDIAPNDATNVDTSECDDECPGYPADTCGNAADELYGYIQLGNPSGTATAPSSSTTRSSTSSTTSDSSTTTTSHSTSIETHDGQVTTITIGGSDSTAAADSANGSDNDDGGSGISGGTIAGIVVGVVGGIALIVAAIIFFLAKRRQRSDSPDGSQSGTIDGRQSKGSQMSYAGAKGMFGDNHSHTLSNGSSHTPQRMPTFTDNRLNTGAVLYPNGRRPSDVSLQDNADYSRPVLRLTNPD
ncbi:hypothetical protein BJX68DRAFT_234963 [Aspergillus pseudodeflectus]|uniref:WSC domain-containing protein n=2 Tax=Aspergillus subgen. Nidulantes TaxID=2720870 RepID=A0A0U5G0M0_ASPCI|nr:hypothetical protein ASPCAL04120 [Aspergillus calidoustus]